MKFILALLITSLAGMGLAEELQTPFWLAKVRVKCEDMVSTCMGAIIEDNYLITTASCVNKCNDSVRIIKIFVSDYSTSGSKLFGEKVKATEVTIHPKYNSSETQKINDLAVVKFKCPDFPLAKVSLNDSCSPDHGFSVIHFNKTSETYSTYEARSGRKKKCKQSYENWNDSQQVCILATSCSDKSESLITDDHHNVLYGLPIYASMCDNNENTIIAAMELCKHHEWITNKTKGAQCVKKPPKPPTPPRQIVTTQPTTATTAATTTAAPTTPKPSGCSIPANIANGDVTYTSLSPGSVAVYSCDRGYAMKGERKLKCEGSSWSNDPPTCDIKKCGPPPKIENGMVSSDGEDYGSKATYQCNKGYEMKGTDTMTCEATGKWFKKAPSCKQTKVSKCNNPPLLHKMTVDIPESLTEGAKAKYSCTNRYKLVGDSVLTCENGKWAGDVPYCKDCPAFGAVSNGVVTVLLNVTIHLTVQVKCNTGYIIQGESINNCNKGKWKYSKATCKALKCPVPTSISNGSVTTSGLTYGSLAIYQCNKGFIVSGFQKRVCKSDGTWAGTPPSCKNASSLFCKPYERIPCGTTANSGGQVIGATVTYTPNSNAQLMGASKITCLSNGRWSAPTPVCRWMCPMTFKLENGDHRLIMNDDTPDYEMEMTCVKGYEMVGVKNFTCKNGAWNRAPSQTKCQKPCICPKVKNGNVTCFKNGYYQFITVECKKGFTKKGALGICRGGAYLSAVPTCT